MPARYIPTKRRLIVDYSENNDNSTPPPKSPRTAPRSTRSPPCNPPPTTNVLSSTLVPYRPAAVASNITASVSSRLRPKPTDSRLKQTSTLQKALVKTHPLQSLSPALQCSPSSSHSVTKPSTVSQHEDFDDLIEDNFSDDDIVPSGVARTPAATFPGRSRNNKCSQSVTTLYNSCRENGEVTNESFTKHERFQNKANMKSYKSCNTTLLELRNPVSSNSFLSQNVAKVKTAVSDPRPWPERFAPKYPADLAVNPKKVSEVRSWLEHVLDGFSKQRLLVLRGSAGTGKTATVNALSTELDFEVLEWRNSSGDTHREAGVFGAGLAGTFEEFIGRAGKFGSLDMAPTSPGAKPTQMSLYSDSGGIKKRIILIEDFPNALFTSSSSPLSTFRHTIKSFLAIPPPSRTAPPLPPLVLIISETSINSGAGAFTAHRLLSPDILHHPLAASITFNKIAPTFMVKALSAIISRESRESGRKFGPSKRLMEALATSGDVRSAILCLEFLAVNGESGAFSAKVPFTGKGKQRLGSTVLNELEREMLAGVTQRESQLGIFHAVGKVVHNKRYGDGVEDPYVLPPPKPLLDIQPYRARASRIDINSLMDESGTDVQTLISGLHENYLGSCNFLGGFSRRTHSLQDLLDCVNNCVEGLSDSDVLASPRPYYKNFGVVGGGNYGGPESNVGAAGIKQDEISFQVAVRGILIALPSPVKRDAKDNKIYYPTNHRLWAQKEEIEDMVDILIRRSRWPDDEYIGGGSGGVPGPGRLEMTLERLPYLMVILKARQRKKSGKNSYGTKPSDASGGIVGWNIRELEKVIVLRGIGESNEDTMDEEFIETLDELETADGRERGARATTKDRARAEWGRKTEEKGTADGFGIVGMESLVLVDDDIEDNW